LDWNTSRVARRPEVIRALNELRTTHAAFTESALRRNEAIIAASETGCTLREISNALDSELSHEVIRGIVGPKAGVAFEWEGDVFQVSEPQTRALIYKAEGFGRGAFSGDVALLAAGEEWLPAAADLAIVMRQVHVGLSNEPITLDRAHGFALFQILRLTYMTLSQLSDLRERLAAAFGNPGPIPRGRPPRNRRR
jgi:DNA-binding transcriptional MerR regulator